MGSLGLINGEDNEENLDKESRRSRRPFDRKAQMSNEELAAQYKEQADDERAAGGSIVIDTMLPSISITMSSGEEYYYQELNRAVKGSWIL